ncbi:hypothetical protein [Streptomyces huiliensis]|nr:hypothetical protein [Streptomyces huiliensis]MBZ4318665.1 hypothetical protein [Streptomyces huiliensis]
MHHHIVSLREAVSRALAFVSGPTRVTRAQLVARHYQVRERIGHAG